MLDTNTCIFAIRGARKNGKAYRYIYDKLKNQKNLVISSLVFAKLMHGVELSESRNENTRELADFLCGIDILPFDEEAAEEYGEIRANLQKKGLLIGTMDILIGAHAKAIGAVLVTNNKKDFERINGLRIDDWKK